jgi:hypothetical protein
MKDGIELFFVSLGLVVVMFGVATFIGAGIGYVMGIAMTVAGWML